MSSRRAFPALPLAMALISASMLGCGGGGSDTSGEPAATEGAPQAPSEEQPLSASEEHGRELFVEKCGSCHTFDAAGTQGQIGPNLGDIPLDEPEVVEQIENGGGAMPAGLVSGQDAQDVATFVANNGPG